MKIKGSYCLFFVLSVCFSQALALDLSYKSDIPADNKPSEEYLKKRNELESGNWNTKKLAEDNTLAEKREDERREYNNKYQQKNSLGLAYDWDNKAFKPFAYDAMKHLNRSLNRKCYRETRQKLEKEQGNGYSNADIADACGHY
ncbi:hypothetical protein Xbed_00797 [Xenorhabdus beddingii]|uniref:Uncharacterized protein n=1 Tax=Xenorhabdus beddingii TaxID=40578 RepID=A0A1Y2SPY5_9GAMM|nr:hypothetical protein [Xenorhabdus beddingii]OTA21146.1 hypothetical protein Xbed_00797 [Xenorhabdus beddingii]